VAEASGGVPLLVEEFLASLIDAELLRREGDGWQTAEEVPALVPPSFAAVVADRLASLTDAARRALAAAAVIDEHIDSRLVASITGLDEATVIEGLREAVRCQLVDELRAPAPTRFRFHHGLGRAAVLDRVAEPERRRLATLALEALQALDVDGLVTGTDRRHLTGSLALTTGDADLGLRVLLDTAAATMAQGACASARRTAELALRLASSTADLVEVHEVLLDACVASGDATRAAEVGGQLLGHLGRLDADPVRLARVHVRLAEVAVATTDWAGADRHVQDAMLVVEEMPPDLEAATNLVRASIALCRHEPDEAAAHARLAVASARNINDQVKLAQAATLLGRAQRVSDIHAARQAFAEALDVAYRVGDKVLIARAAHELATLDVLEAGPTDAMEQARRLAEAAGALALVAICDIHLAILHWLHFDLERSRTCARRALDLALRYKLGLLVPTTAVMVPGPDALLGRPTEVVAVFDRNLQMMDAEVEATQRGHILALLALALEDRAETLEQLELAAMLVPPYSDVARAPHCGLRALLLAVEGAPTAPSIADHLCGDPAVVGVPRALVDLSLAVLQGRQGDLEAAAERADRALAALHGTPWFRAMALRLTAESAMQHEWGRPVEWLRSAHDFFAGAGIEAPAAACRQLLRRAGAPPPRQPATGEHPELARLGITRRESEILFLVADGRSNREIADRLVLSVRTVEKHVENLMMKTSTANRTQLAALASRVAKTGALTT
ncbi:MAG: helix-turn-helix transcriptional regulator, partial [Actinomycetota bacterium]|nr:helix-turn-helix transcriptional regulator [Actinomycetota bacterium]